MSRMDRVRCVGIILFLVGTLSTFVSGQDCPEVGGSWEFTVTDTLNECGEGLAPPHTISIEMAQSGCEVSVAGLSASNVELDLDGSVGQITYDFPEDGGETTVTIDIEFSDGGCQATGKGRWTWMPVGAGESCSGGYDLTGEKDVCEPVGLPDLVIAELGATLLPGEEIQIAYRIENIGNAPATIGATGVEIQTWISVDAIRDPGDTPVATSPLTTDTAVVILPGEALEGSQQVPLSLPAGVQRHLFARVNHAERLEESDFSNNEQSVTVETEALLPDLIVSELEVLSTAGNRIDYRFRIQNIGEGPAVIDTPITVQGWLSADEFLDLEKDPPAGEQRLGHDGDLVLESGEEFEGTFGSTVDLDPVATPHLLLGVDASDDLEESDETNNLRAVTIPLPEVGFRRGDYDANGRLEISDPIASLTFQFLGGAPPGCHDAADTDDSGKLEISDPIFSLSHQFLGTAPPPAPGALECGPDGTLGDDLDCEVPHDC